jgi:hypothetical protein
MKKEKYTCKCGGVQFLVKETIIHIGEVHDDEGILSCKDTDGRGIGGKVECADCGEKYPINKFKEIEFC